MPYSFTYAKDQWFAALQLIYRNLKEKERRPLSGWIRLAIGAYSEPTECLHLGADFISRSALAHLKGLPNQPTTLKAFNSFATRRENHLRHEHMTPKNALKSVLDKLDKKDWESPQGRARQILDKCSGCAIVTEKEDKILSRSKHPDIDDGKLRGDISDFRIFGRYIEANQKQEEIKIELIRFNLEDVFSCA